MPTTIAAWLAAGQRIAFECGGVAFEQFKGADTEALYAIRNHSTVLPFMPSPEPMPYERHLAWVESQLLAPSPGSPLVVIGRADGVPAAFALLKPTPWAGVLEIGVMVAGVWQRGTVAPRVGGAMFAIAARLFGAHTIVSHVHPGNRQALLLNQGCGLLPTDESQKPGEIMFRAALADLLAPPAYRRWIDRSRLRVLPD
ncbi:GNAT family N-acetyltransferase [Telluria beijingensis]|uniref:GNAT family N-acetyltransferase n=1 Tax=Telluria beijingensis TaxID=3068633 RepID=UPI002795C02B|nr:GNAT family protein [Massilia sp. REN29]